MSQPDNLLSALQQADMLEIDDLHAWQFSLDEAQLQAPSSAVFLQIECMDGRALRKWQFSLAEVQAAQYQADTESWTLHGADQAHRLKCFAAISGDNQDEPDNSANDSQ